MRYIFHKTGQKLQLRGVGGGVGMGVFVLFFADDDDNNDQG